jgi:hypothetical protein
MKNLRLIMSERIVKPPVNGANTLTKKNKTKSSDSLSNQQVHRSTEKPSLDTLTPDVIMQLQATHGNQYVNRLVQRMMNDESPQSKPSSSGLQKTNLQREVIQRDGDEPGTASKVAGGTVSLGDITGAIVQAYEAYNGDDSANTIVKALSELSGNIADTTGGLGDTGEGASSGLADPSAKGAGTWSRLVGGVSNIVTKGSELVSQSAGYVKSGLDYVGLGGGNASAATSWIGGWAKSASDVVSPYAWYTDIAAGSTKAISGITDGWSMGYVLADLSDLASSTSNASVKDAAKLLFNIAWWKRLDDYGGGLVGAIEGGGAAYLGPLSKGITTVLTKTYESGWGTYILRAMGSSVSSSVLSNAQIDQRAEADKTALNSTIRPMVDNCKLDDLVALCQAVDDLGMTDLIKAIWTEFNNPPSGREGVYRSRKTPFENRIKSAGLGHAIK